MIEHVAIPEERINALKRDRRWEDELKKFVSVSVRIGNGIELEGDDPIQLLRAKEVMKSFGRGFDFNIALVLLDENYFLETIDVKSFAGNSKDRQVTLKGRVIGKGGDAKEIIERYCCVEIAIYGKTISIIGKWEDVGAAREAIEMLLSGSKHTSVYRFLKERKVG